MMRIGHGYDVHRLVYNRKLLLGGVDIPYEKGLLGHSDADVLVHAIMDSFLGAAALGDIGDQFPDDDSTYQNADSLGLLAKVCILLKDKEYKIINIDPTIIAQSPKLKQFIYQMRRNIAAVCNIDISQISVKATTEEKLGFTGASEGIAVHAVCLLQELK